MKDQNRLTEKLMVAIAENLIKAPLKPIREIIDDYLEKAWHEGYEAGQEDADEQQAILIQKSSTVADKQTQEKP